MEIAVDTCVVMEYTVRLDDGSYLKGEDGPVSLNFVMGYNQLLPGLEKRLPGLAEGAEVELVIPAGEAFGEYDSGLVKRRHFNEFPEGRSFQPGKWVVATNHETQAQYSFFVKEKTDEIVVLDYNHPLAGRDLYYHVKIVRVRPAQREELEFLQPCKFKEDDEDSTAGQA